MGRKSFLRKFSSLLGYNVYFDSDKIELQTINQLFNKYKKKIGTKIAESQNYTIKRGPFKGLKLPISGTWDDSTIASKIIGSYECELFDVINGLRQRNIGCVINIGASEGYYAIGLKMIMPEIVAYSYDADESSYAALETCQTLNGIQILRLNDFHFGNPLKELDTSFEGNIAFFVDCEGCEANILNCPRDIANSAYFIVELHEFLVPQITEQLIDFFKSTHKISIIDQQHRDIDRYPELEHYNDIQRFILTHEGRPDHMQWIYASPEKDN